MGYDGKHAAWENRRFLWRAVDYVTRERGIRQFIDVGSGLPTARNTHEIAQEIDPAARVVYVDNDPIVLSHGRALLAENGNTAVVAADVRDPEGIFSAPETAALIDFSHVTTEGAPPEKVKIMEGAYERATSPMVFRPRDEIEGMLEGWSILPPGLVRPWEWPAVAADSPQTPYLLGAVAVKDA